MLGINGLRAGIATEMKHADSMRSGRYRRAAMSAYTSAEVHTVQPVYIWAGAALLVPLLGWLGVHMLHQFSAPQHAPTAQRSLISGAGQRLVPTSARSAAMTPGQYADRFTPRFAAIPWSAPAYDSAPLGPPPRLACMAYHADTGDRCTCIEIHQGVVWTIPQNVCLAAPRSAMACTTRTMCRATATPSAPRISAGHRHRSAPCG